MKKILMKLVNKIKNIQVEILIVYTIIIIAASFAWIGSAYIVNRIKIAEKQNSTPVEKPSQYPDFDAIKGPNPDLNIKSIKITAGCPEGGCVNNTPASTTLDGIEKNYIVKGNFSRAYLYIEAAVDYKRPLTSYDDIYFLFNNWWGGHLSPDKNSLPVPPSDISRYLYNLQSISYSLRRTTKPNKFDDINLFVLLQNGALFHIHIAISSDRPGRVLKEASIYYQCLEDSDCGIEEN